MAIGALLYLLPQISFDKDTNEARKTVKEYFKYMNIGDKEAVLNLMRNPESVERNIKNTSFIKLLWIREGSKWLSAGYMTHGLGKTQNPYSVRVFHLVYYNHYKNGVVSPDGNGIKIKDIYVTKNSKNSPWLISAMGEG